MTVQRDVPDTGLTSFVSTTDLPGGCLPAFLPRPPSAAAALSVAGTAAVSLLRIAAQQVMAHITEQYTIVHVHAQNVDIPPNGDVATVWMCSCRRTCGLGFAGAGRVEAGRHASRLLGQVRLTRRQERRLAAGRLGLNARRRLDDHADGALGWRRVAVRNVSMTWCGILTH